MIAMAAFAAAPGCLAPNRRSSAQPPPPAPLADTSFDSTVPKPVAPRDRLERKVHNRGRGLKLVDRLMDRRTPLPAFDRQPLPDLLREQPISDGVLQLTDRGAFAEPQPLPSKDVTIEVGIARSTFKTRETEEVLSAVQPFIDLVQREVNIRGDARLFESARDLFYAMLDDRVQMATCNVFEYLIVRDWFAQQPDNGAVPLATATPARPRTTALDAELVGTPGTSIELVVAAGSKLQNFADLKGTRLALAANVVPAPGTFLTRLLADAGHPRNQAYFSKVTLRRYAKDALIDVLKGKADVACVDQGTVGALSRFYGLGERIRTLAVSPCYNVDVLFTSVNNLASRREEIELTQRQLTTLGKDPEGQEVLFFFDVEGWHNYRQTDLDIPREHYADYLKFLNETPVDLVPLLDPNAVVDRRTYDRFGDE